MKIFGVMGKGFVCYIVLGKKVLFILNGFCYIKFRFFFVYLEMCYLKGNIYVVVFILCLILIYWIKFIKIYLKMFVFSLLLLFVLVFLCYKIGF